MGMRNRYDILVSLKGRDHSENLGVYGRITLTLIQRKRCAGVDWIHLAEARG